VIITNQTSADYWFGPMHLPAGSGTGTLNLDDTSDTSLYLIDDAVADMVNTLFMASPPMIAVTSYATPFPRPTGTPDVLHGIGSPQGLVYASQGSLYLRRDNPAANSLYVKTTGVTYNTGWKCLTRGVLTLAANSAGATPAIDTDVYDVVHITGQTTSITSFTTNLSGAPGDGDQLRISVTGGTGSVALAFGSSFESSTVTLPTTTAGTARLDIGFLWNTETSKWRCVALA
jgi:hypothetical protein